MGTFTTNYRFEGKYEPGTVVEIKGRCQHPIAAGSGTGGFEGAEGRLDFKDIIGDPVIYVYRGHISGSARLAQSPPFRRHDGTGQAATSPLSPRRQRTHMPRSVLTRISVRRGIGGGGTAVARSRRGWRGRGQQRRWSSYRRRP